LPNGVSVPRSILVNSEQKATDEPAGEAPPSALAALTFQLLRNTNPEIRLTGRFFSAVVSSATAIVSSPARNAAH